MSPDLARGLFWIIKERSRQSGGSGWSSVPFNRRTAARLVSLYFFSSGLASFLLFQQLLFPSFFPDWVASSAASSEYKTLRLRRLS